MPDRETKRVVLCCPLVRSDAPPPAVHDPHSGRKGLVHARSKSTLDNRPLSVNSRVRKRSRGSGARYAVMSRAVRVHNIALAGQIDDAFFVSASAELSVTDCMALRLCSGTARSRDGREVSDWS